MVADGIGRNGLYERIRRIRSRRPEIPQRFTSSTQEFQVDLLHEIVDLVPLAYAERTSDPDHDAANQGIKSKNELRPGRCSGRFRTMLDQILNAEP